MFLLMMLKSYQLKQGVNNMINESELKEQAVIYNTRIKRVRAICSKIDANKAEARRKIEDRKNDKMIEDSFALDC